MNTISNEEIKTYLETEYQNLLQEYSEKNLLGLFTAGNVNYGFAETIDEIKFATVYMPTFEEICTTKPKIITINNTTLIDARLLYNITVTKCDFAALELLYSKYSIISPHYTDCFNEILDVKEIMAHYCEKSRVMKAFCAAKKAIERNDLFEASRLRIAAQMYLSGFPCEECFCPLEDYHVEYLWAVKHGDVKPKTEEIINNFNKLINMASDDDNLEVEGLIKQCIISLVQRGFNTGVDIDSFFSSLTNKEKIAWNYIKENLEKNILNISILKAIEETGISRPVWNNLFSKIEKNKIAVIHNMGVKGMKIDLKEKSILKKG